MLPTSMSLIADEGYLHFHTKTAKASGETSYITVSKGGGGKNQEC